MEKPLILGRYRPLEVKGTGGFSTVEVAYDTRIQRKVAIKRIPLSPTGSGQPVGLDEARTAALLANPHIVQVYDFACEGDEAFIIMEYLDGPSLSDIIEENGGLFDLDEAAYVVKSVAEALEYAHENQVLHLDVKPDNILIGHDGTVKLADFGVSELASANGFAQAQGGTIGYMPPEQIRGEEMDGRTDEWGFASVVYEMLTGENPFIAGTLDAAVGKIENADVAAPSLFREDLDANIDEVILDALSPNMDVRFEDVAGFANAVMLYLGDPAEGHRSLKQRMTEAHEDEEHEADEHIGVWDRLGAKGRNAIARVVCAVGCAWMTWIASTVGSFPFNVLLTITSAVAIGTILAPQLGSILAVVAMVVALFFAGAYPIAIGLAVLGFAWWFLFGRRLIMDSTLPFMAPLFSSILLAPLYPLVNGFCVGRLRTVAATFFGAMLTLIVCAATGGDTLLSCNLTPVEAGTIMPDFLALATSPGTWVIVVGWVFAGLSMSALCSRGSRVVSIIGSALGCVLMLGTIVVAGFLTNGFVWTMPSLTSCLNVGLAFVVMCLITALGAPYQVEEEPEEER